MPSNELRSVSDRTSGDNESVSIGTPFDFMIFVTGVVGALEECLS